MGPKLPQIPRKLSRHARNRLQASCANFDEFIERALHMKGEHPLGEKRCYFPFMWTPLVLGLAGVEAEPLYIAADKVRRILIEHRTMTPEMLKALPIALADPLLVFRRVSPMGWKSGLALLLDMADASGVSVRAAIHLGQRAENLFIEGMEDFPGFDPESEPHRGTRFINRLATAFSATSGNGWFARNVAIEDVLYINKAGMAEWTAETGAPFSPCEWSYEELTERGIYHEKDLARAWKENPAFYGRRKRFCVEASCGDELPLDLK